MMSEGKILVRVLTVPNGYTLDIERDGRRNGYLYFDIPCLLEGVLFHLAFGEDKTESVEMIHRLLEAAVTWHDREELLRKLVAYENEIKALKRSVAIRDREIEERRSVLGKVRDELEARRKLVKELKAELKNLQKEIAEQ